MFRYVGECCLVVMSIFFVCVIMLICLLFLLKKDEDSKPKNGPTTPVEASRPKSRLEEQSKKGLLQISGLKVFIEQVFPLSIGLKFVVLSMKHLKTFF